MQWCAVNTKPHQEQQAELNLQQLGVETFFPRLKRSKVIRRRRRTVIGPLFPGYLFVRLNIADQYRSASYARGVRKIVSFGSAPAVVEDQLIDSLKRRMDDRCVVAPTLRFKSGELVRIEEGPLCGLEAVFERELSDQQRVVLLLRTLAAQWRVIVPHEQVANM